MSTKKFDPATNIQRQEVFGEFGGVNPSITDSSTFTFMTAKTMLDTFHGEAEGCFLYSRHWNPTNLNLAQALAAMEGTESAWVTGSGMGAITTVLLQLCSAGDHIVTSVTTYGGTYAFLKNYLPKFNIDVTFVNISDLEAVEAAIRPNTKLVYTESMTNPMLQISDMPKLSEIAHKHGAKLVVDNTFTPMIFAPYQLGADIVCYSMTKFINGKNDCVAGAICASGDFINAISDVNDGTAMLLGPVLDPMRSSSILKNLHTLHIRMMQHSKNAMFLAKKFKEIGLRFNYPGMTEHQDHDLMNSMRNEDFGYGGMIAIDMETAERAADLMECMQIRGVGYHAVSLGYFKTLFSNSGKSTSSEVPEDVQLSMGMSPGLVRFSVGLDHDIETTFNVILSCLKDKNLI
ncbi:MULTISPECIES: aminotransferase class I/II-fold pyridoxal phosphate-dependent enzyme [unclassified Lentimicrobium]|uniref:aminotransferase class I/II-fold pyridoxal phosphate-dependent enzyme n=1 Tax=unclassified Lentimicrobium TaxID=2677434 RepID=UPI001553313D|nr:MULTISPECIES: aminotransferase class I/II-fold pyridoxal phosphate-dependent enzyme [unclassified Lentimicrobium]NPD46526.1 aminotransferase class V-fold PLP-dependent enzyme [Lentimicrobium sp. S6]NPD85175.1 aminotransferase class V-fold PLP-dependent enzyme [Lentimicrobium sp. L6]